MPLVRLPACLPAWQAPGFQYVLRYGAHSPDVTALALATKLKLAAVGDASGHVTLLDLLQPAQLFAAQAPLPAPQQAVAALAFGSHLMPPGAGGPGGGGGGGKDDPGMERCGVGRMFLRM